MSLCGDGIGATGDNVRCDRCVGNMTWRGSVCDGNGGSGGGFKL